MPGPSNVKPRSVALTANEQCVLDALAMLGGSATQYAVSEKTGLTWTSAKRVMQRMGRKGVLVLDEVRGPAYCGGGGTSLIARLPADEQLTETEGQVEQEDEDRSPEELRRRAHILVRLTNLKRARFGSKDFWQGCEEVEIATSKGFQVVSVQDGTPPSKLRAGELVMLVDDPTPWEDLDTDELVEWAEKLGLSTEPWKRVRRKVATPPSL